MLKNGHISIKLIKKKIITNGHASLMFLIYCMLTWNQPLYEIALVRDAFVVQAIQLIDLGGSELENSVLAKSGLH